MVERSFFFCCGDYVTECKSYSNETGGERERLSIVYSSLPTVDGHKMLQLNSPDGRSIKVLDEKNEGLVWLCRYQQDGKESLVVDEDVIENFSDWREDSLLSNQFLLRFILVYSSFFFSKRNRFRELRHLIRALQFVKRFGWARDINIVYLGQGNKALRLKRAAVFGSLYALLSTPIITYIALFCLFLYLCF